MQKINTQYNISNTNIETSAENSSINEDEGNENQPLTEKLIIGGKKLEGLEEEILFNTRQTKFDVMLMIWSFSFRHNLTAIATEDLCKLVNSLVGNEYILTTKYMSRKIFGFINYSFHFYCPNCLCYLKEVLKSEKTSALKLHCSM